MSIYGR